MSRGHGQANQPISRDGHTPAVASKSTQLQRGRRQGLAVKGRLLGELRDARMVLGISQQQLAQALGCSQSIVSRRESAVPGDIDVVTVAETAALLGLELSAGLHPVGQALRDRGSRALIGRFRSILASAWRVSEEVPFPNPGDPRWWDMLLALADHLVGVEAETRIRDSQALVRRMHGRQRDGGVHVVVLLLSDSIHNRGLVATMREALGPDFSTSPRTLLAALRGGRPLPGSGVVLR
jgi:transcriptional regulator with XRE-family HTH domain